MAAKKMPAKKAMPAKKSAPAKTSAAKVRMANEKSMVKFNSGVESSIKKRYGSFGSSDFKGYEKNRKGFQSMFADVVSEGPMGQNNSYMKAAEKIAGAAWDKKFGKKKK
jgi:hypothetical protein